MSSGGEEPAPASQASKSAAISALVQQLRAGKIDRQELFDKLTKLHKGEANPAEFADFGSGSSQHAPPAVGYPTGQAETGPQSSSQPPQAVPGVPATDRNAIIKKLLEQTRQARSKLAAVGDGSGGSEQDVGVSVAAPPALAASQPVRVPQPAPQPVPPPQPPQPQVTPVTQSYPGTSVRPSTTAVSADAFISAQRQYATPVSVQPPFVPKSRPQSASSRTARTSGGQNVLSRSYVSGKSVDDASSYWEDGKSRHTETNSELDECTFQPKIRPLPASYGSQKALESVPFYQRVSQWQKHKSEEITKKREKEDDAEVDDCTFHPQINPKSRVTAETKRTDANLPVSERLYQASQRPVSASRARSSYSGYETKEEEELRTECTFKPKINQNRNATPVRSKYMMPTQSSTALFGGDASQLDVTQGSVRQSHRLPSGMEECTFAPRTNPIPRDMAAAKAYTQQEVYDRLAATKGGKIVSVSPRSRNASQGEDREKFFDEDATGLGQPVLDLSTYLSALENRKNGTSVTSPRPGGRAGGDGGSVNSAVVSKEEREKMFTEFLARQKAAEMRKERKLEESASKVLPKHTPNLNRKSLTMAKSAQSGDFLQRVAKDALKKEHKAMQIKAAHSLDPECTFHPTINPKSKELPARSAVEMSRGDMLKRESAQRLMRLKAEQAELDGLTFEPEINPVSKTIPGRLRVLEDPDTYIERVQQEARMFSEKQRRAMQESEMQEFAECTFKPQVHDAPTYIKRIARAMALTRAAQPPAAENSRPDWR